MEDKTSKFEISGVYKLKCGTCPKVYIGQTGRTFRNRIQEHHKSYVNKKTNSTYSNHLLEENHIFNEEFEILHIENKGLKVNHLEAMEINKLKNSNILMNDQLDLNRSPLLNLFS
ncbi:hypothetical protein GO639_10705 [Staphylococcus aureus]|nr:hypothetical protein [Staphylococcus aureus]